MHWDKIRSRLSANLELCVIHVLPSMSMRESYALREDFKGRYTPTIPGSVLSGQADEIHFDVPMDYGMLRWMQEALLCRLRQKR